jgi:hypothetical protein
VEVFRSYERKALKRRSVDIWYKGYAAGYRDSHYDTLEFFTEQVISEIHEDAVLSMTADLDTLERIVEIIEAVRDNGETQRDKSED